MNVHARLSFRTFLGISAYILFASTASLLADSGNSPVPSRSKVAACSAGPTALCLSSQRFRVEVEWKDFSGRTGMGQAVPLTADTGYFWFFDSANVELIVKVLDARTLNGHFWVFYGALSNVEYALTVTDTGTGNIKRYFNPARQFASVGDTRAFPQVGSGAWIAESATAEPPMTGQQGPRIDYAALKSSASSDLKTCRAGATDLCLSGGRFRVEVDWKDSQGRKGQGAAVRLSADTGYFWFFDSNNVELVVKVLDARSLGAGFWIFYGALSNVEYRITVIDTLTGNVNTYSNPPGQFASVGDTQGFPAGYSVAVRLDQSRVSSKVITPEGGTVSAAASDGTVFTLSVPPGALLSDTTISMTPVSAVERLPLSGGLAAAVQLAPEGLLLFEPATLTIDPAAPIPVEEETVFAWRGAGDEFFLYPPEDTSAPAVTLRLMHFSGYGAGRGSAADRSAQEARQPANPGDRTKQKLSRPTSRQRQRSRQNLPPDPADRERIKEILEDELFPLPPLPVPIDCKHWEQQAWQAREKANERKHNGLDPSFWDAYFEVALAEAAKCYDTLYEDCRTSERLSAPRNGLLMLKIFKALQKYGRQGSVEYSKIPRCLSFRFTFESEIQEKLSIRSGTPAVGWELAYQVSHGMKADFPVSWLDDISGLNGVGVTLYEPKLFSFEGEVWALGNRCKVFMDLGAPLQDSFIFSRGMFDLAYYEGDVGGPPGDMEVTIYPGNVKVGYKYSASCSAMSAPVPDLRWGSLYYRFHQDEQQTGIRDWVFESDGFFAKKCYGQRDIDLHLLPIPGYSHSAEELKACMYLKHTPR